MAKIDVNEFKSKIKEEIRILEEEHGYKESDGYGFALWCANLIKKNDPQLEPDPEEALTFGGSDLKADLVFDDPDRKFSLIGQCKFRSLAKSSSLVDETELNDFFSRHQHFMNKKWVKENGSEKAVDLLCEYKDKIEAGYKISYFFLTTSRLPKDSKRIEDLIEQINLNYQKAGINIECSLYDFSNLKDYYVHSLSLGESTPDEVDIELQTDNYFERMDPYPTIIASIKGNTLINLYKRYKNSIFTYNIRNYLGDRNINQAIRETAEKKPKDFFYFNNGISAICTNYSLSGKTIKAEGFQIINGAQTVGALRRAGNNDDLRVLFRLTKTKSVKTESGINQEIIRYNNTQNNIKISDFRANDPIQKWLEGRFKKEKLHPSLGNYFYKRKRSFEKAPKGKTAITLEEFGKIRYAFLWEPTLVSSSPKQLWANKSEGGSYEFAFGVEEEIQEFWSDDTFIEALVAILCFKEIERVTKEIIRTTKYRQMGRLKYLALHLMSVYLQDKIGTDQYKKLLDNKDYFKSTWDAFWVNGKQHLFIEYDNAQENSSTPYALARNEQRFNKILERFKAGLVV